MKVIFTRLFRLFAIVYYHHYAALEGIGAVSHLNTSFKHFIFFIWEYDLVSEAEQEALADIIREIKVRYASAFPHCNSSSGGGGDTNGRCRSNSGGSASANSANSSSKGGGGDGDVMYK